MAAQTPEMRLPQTETRTAGGRRLLAVGAATVVASTVTNVLVAAALAGWLKVPAAFSPLRPISVASLTVVGVTGAVVVFAVLARRRPDPVPAFLLVAAVALVISWLPDLLVLVTGVFPGTTTPAVLSLMALHVTAAGIAALVLALFGRRR